MANDCWRLNLLLAGSTTGGIHWTTIDYAIESYTLYAAYPLYYHADPLRNRLLMRTIATIHCTTMQTRYGTDC
jgi:hypothetical protein